MAVLMVLDRESADSVKSILRVSTMSIRLKAKVYSGQIETNFHIRDRELTSTPPSTARSTAAMGWPTKGTVLKMPDLPMRMLRSSWWTLTNY